MATARAIDMRSRTYLFAAVLGTLGNLIAPSVVHADDEDENENEYEGDGPEADAVVEFKLDDLMTVALRRSPDLVRAKIDRAGAKGTAGASRANQQWVLTAGAQAKKQAVTGQVEVAPFGVVGTASINAVLGLGRNLPTGGRIEAELGVGHIETELNIPEKLQPFLDNGNATTVAGMTPTNNGTEVDRYSQIQTTARVTLKQPLVRGFGPGERDVGEREVRLLLDAGLGNLIEVNDLEIVDTQLTSIATKQTIKVYGSLHVSGNTKLANLNNLVVKRWDGVTQGGSFTVSYTIRNNAALTAIDGLKYIAQVDSDLRITDNPRLATVEFNELTKVTGGVYITGTGATSIRLPVLATLGRLEIASNPALTQISGLAVASIAGDVTLRGNPQLVTVGTMSALTGISGALVIDDNDALVDLTNLIPTGMSRISGGLTISNNARLTGLGWRVLRHALAQCHRREAGRCDVLLGRAEQRYPAPGRGLSVPDEEVRRWVLRHRVLVRDLEVCGLRGHVR